MFEVLYPLHDTAGITLYTLTRHLDPVLRVVHSMLTEPLFEEGELAVYLQKKKQAYLVEMKRVSFRARKQFAPALYGEDHPYGRVTEEADFGRIRPGTLEQFHRQAYLGSRPAALVSGRISQAVTDHIGEVLSGFPVGDPGTSQDPFPASQPAGEKRRLVPVPGSLQSAIRIGRVVENRHHPDYLAMEVLNTLLGGYFGSRLMKNIREDKGFTYGIGSFILPLHNAGTFWIVSEVGASHSLAAISECYAEMEKLREEPVENEELEIVRNYMMGEMVRDFDGPFSTAESYRAVLEDGLDFSHYRNMIRAIRDTGPEALQELAGRILLPEAMTEVVAGDPAMIEHA